MTEKLLSDTLKATHNYRNIADYLKLKMMKRLVYLAFPALIMTSCTPEVIDEILEPDLEINSEKTVYVIAGSPSDGYPYEIVKTVIDKVETVVGDPDHNYWGLRISPDKTQFICFVSPYNGTSDKGYDEISEAELWLYNIDGTNGQLITDLVTNGFSSMGYANWHPSGSQIVMTATKADVADGKSQLYSVTLSDGSVKKISTRDVVHSHPCFSPDGALLTYAAYANTTDTHEEDMEIYYADYDAGAEEIMNEKRITTNTIEDKFPGFSGDGVYITYNYTYDISSNVDRIVMYDISTEYSTEFNDIQDKYSTKNALWSDENTFYFEENITGKLNTYVRRINIDTESEIKVVRDINAVLSFRDPQEIE